MRQHNDQNKRDKWTHGDLQNFRLIKTNLTPGMNSCAPEGYAVPVPLVATVSNCHYIL